MADGRLTIIEEGALFTCACGKVKDGSKRGPRGGRQWKWVTDEGMEFCAKECPKNDTPTLDDQGRGEWEAEQAIARHEG